MRFVWLAGVLLLGMGSASARPGEARDASREATSAVRSLPAHEDLPQEPYRGHFERNLGQSAKDVRFLARTSGLLTFIHDGGAAFLPLEVAGKRDGRLDQFRMEFVGAGRDIRYSPGGALPGRSHYLLGRDPLGWITGVRQHGTLEQEGVWPGVDVRWRVSASGSPAFDLIVAPGADPGRILLGFSGMAGMEVEEGGELRLSSGRGALRLSRPILYQVVRGTRIPVSGRFTVAGRDRVTLRAGDYDPTLPLVIDPEVQYSSYLGGTDGETIVGSGIHRASDGSWYLAGDTSSSNFPVSGPYQTDQLNWDLFVTRFSASGATLLSSTYLGGNYEDRFGGLAVNGDDAAIVTGWTLSTNFPLLSAYQGALSSGSQDAFVTRLAPDGASLEWSTYFGGSDVEEAHAVVVDGADDIYIAGRTKSSNLPTASAFQGSLAGGWDIFVSKFIASSGTLAHSGYLGGSGTDELRAMAVDGDGGAMVVGGTLSTNFPTQGALQPTKAAGYDGILAKFTPSGSGLSFSTYLGGNDSEEVMSVAFGPDGAAVVVGYTYSTDFPTVSPYQAARAGTGSISDAFLAKVKADGSGFEYSTYFGGADGEFTWALAVNFAGEAVVLGTTSSTDLPQVEPVQGTLAGAWDLFIARFSQDGAGLEFSTYFGGSANEAAYGLDLDGSVALIGGHTISTDFPTKNPYQAARAGSQTDAFTVRMDVGQGPPRAPSNLMAGLVSLTSVELSWTDNSDDETGFRVERSTEGGPFEAVGTLDTDAVLHTDAGLAADTDFAYRVIAFNEKGDSPPSAAAPVSTPPTPVTAPEAPSGLSAEATGPYEATLSWTDNSANEDFFIVARSTDGTFFTTLATPALGATSYRDSTVLPDRTYSYLVRAANPVGTSATSNHAAVTLPGTVGIGLEKGLLKDSAKFGKDKLALTAVLTSEAGARFESIDPVAGGLLLRLGGWTGTQLLMIAPGDPAWKVKEKSSLWKSPKGSLTRAKVKWVASTGTVTIKISGMNLPETIGNPIVLSIGVDTDGGTSTETWMQVKASWKFEQ